MASAATTKQKQQQQSKNSNNNSGKILTLTSNVMLRGGSLQSIKVNSRGLAVVSAAYWPSSGRDLVLKVKRDFALFLLHWAHTIIATKLLAETWKRIGNFRWNQDRTNSQGVFLDSSILDYLSITPKFWHQSRIANRVWPMGASPPIPPLS